MTNHEKQQRIHQARERADLARLRFSNAVDGVLERVAPQRLTADVLDAAGEKLDDARRDLMQRFRYWPVLVGGLVLAAAAMAFWSPARLVGRYVMRIGSFALATQNLWRPKNE
jgi:type VI protein secretion system component VasF